MLRMEYSKSSLYLISSLDIWRRYISKVIEKGLSKITILLTISLNLIIRLYLSALSLLLNN